MEHWLDEWIRVTKVKRKKKESIHKTVKFGICIYVKYPGSVGAGPRQVATEQGPQEAKLKELSRHEPRNQQAISMELSSDEACCSTGNNQARDQAGITQLSWQLSTDEPTGITQLSWQLSCR